MSGSNAPQGGLITLDELERLIRLLGMLGSSHDGEVLAAARFAQKWVTENATDWRTLLSPPEDALPVTGVAASPDPDALAQAHEADRVQAYANGYQAGMRDIAAQLKAQAAYSQGVAQTNVWVGAAASGLGGGLGGSGAQQASNQGLGAQQAQAASGKGPLGQRCPYPIGSWKAVAWELLEREQAGIPGVFRGPPGASQEQQFVADVLRRGFATLTAAQDKWLRDIAGRNGMSW